MSLGILSNNVIQQVLWQESVQFHHIAMWEKFEWEWVRNSENEDELTSDNVHEFPNE